MSLHPNGFSILFRKGCEIAVVNWHCYLITDKDVRSVSDKFINIARIEMSRNHIDKPEYYHLHFRVSNVMLLSRGNVEELLILGGDCKLEGNHRLV